MSPIYMDYFNFHWVISYKYGHYVRGKCGKPGGRGTV